MERDERIIKVKQDLRMLRNLNHLINTSLRAFEKRGIMLTVIRGSKQITESERISIEADIHSTVEKLSVEKLIKKAAELETRYSNAISKLDIAERTIVTEAFLNGATYKNVGKLMGYSVETVKKKVSKILWKIAEIL